MSCRRSEAVGFQRLRRGTEWFASMKKTVNELSSKCLACLKCFIIKMKHWIMGQIFLDLLECKGASERNPPWL